MANFRYNPNSGQIERAGGTGGSQVSTRFLVMNDGRLVFEGTEPELQASRGSLRAEIRARGAPSDIYAGIQQSKVGSVERRPPGHLRAVSPRLPDLPDVRFPGILQAQNRRLYFHGRFGGHRGWRSGAAQRHYRREGDEHRPFRILASPTVSCDSRCRSTTISCRRFPVDSQAAIAAENLLGTKYINIKKGRNPETIKAGAEIKSLDTREFDDVVQQGYTHSRLARWNFQESWTASSTPCRSARAPSASCWSDETLYNKVLGHRGRGQKLSVSLKVGRKHARQADA